MASLILNTLIFAEHFVCVYRNYYQKSSTVKKIIVTHIVFDAVLLIGCGCIVAYYSYMYSYTGIPYIIVVSILVSHASSIFASCESISRSDHFKMYYRNVMSTQELLKREKTCKKSFKILLWSCGIIIGIVTLIKTTINIADTIEHVRKQNSTSDKIVYSIYKIYQNVIATRYYNEFAVYFMYVMVIYIPYKRLNTLIIETEKRLYCSIQDERFHYVIKEDDTEKWITMFKQLNICAKSLNECYYFQNTFAFYVAMSRYIYLTYHLLDGIITGTIGSARDIISSIITLLYVILVSVSLVIAGQMIKNESLRLYRTLARMNSKLSIGVDRVAIRFVKDFLRLVTTNPVEIKVLSNTYMGMYLVPTCCSIVIYYVVVGLQFNHVV